MCAKQILSENQHRAADPRVNVFVSANAGTGKTSVLVTRLLRILFRNYTDGGAGAKRRSAVLALTYTNAAAAEMRNRILSKLREWAHADDNDLRELLFGIAHNNPASDADIAAARAIFYDFIDNPQMLKIRTIHGFAEEILRRFPIESGVPVAWKLVSGADQIQLQRDAFAELVNSDADSTVRYAFARVADQISEYSLDDLMRVLTGLYRYFFKLNENINNRQQFIENTKQYLDMSDRAEHEFYAFDAVENRANLPNIIAADKKSANYTDKIAAAVPKFLSDNNFTEYKSAFLTASDTKIVNVSKKDYLQSEQELVFALDQQNKNRAIFDNTIALFDLANAFAKKYMDMKQSRGLLDFDDLILYTNKLFANPSQMGWVLSQLDANISDILVDEAQDTNPEQWEILESILANFFDTKSGRAAPSLFVVGDTKQSIYSFQGASPESFAEFRTKINAQTTNDLVAMRDIQLESSFRSAPAVLSVVDRFFGAKSIASLANFRNNIHRVTRGDARGIVELHARVVPDKEDGENTATARTVYIKTIADKIAGLVADGAKPSDIMVLVQRRNPFAGPLIAELQKRAVPVAGSDRIRLPEFLPIRDLLNLTRFVIDPDNDYALACVLKSSLFGLSDSDLYALCHDRANEKLLNRINILNLDIYNLLQEILALKNLPPYSFFMCVLNTDSRREKMISALGKQIIDPLEEFLTICLSYERTQSGGLCEFIEWFINGGAEITREVSADSGVRIMTIHGSKGLDSKIVFLVDTIRTPKSANAQKIKVPVDAGVGWLWRGGADASEKFAAADDTKYVKSLEEYYRLLYVAMTRARDELYIYGFDTNKNPADHAWHTQLWQVLGAKPGDDKIRIADGE